MMRVLPTLIASALTLSLSVVHYAPLALADDQTPAGERSAPVTPSITGDVWILLASGDEEGTIDPSLSQLRGLKQPPFNAYKSMKVLSRKAVPLPMDQPVELELPKRRTLILRLVARLPDGRAKLQLSILRPNQKDTLPRLNVIASAGEPFFVAGQKFEGGTLVIGVRVGEPTKRIP
ncbi:MAG: hypothetical protein ABW321_29740 [Polyangiales bacterium]